jgi:lipid-A-disaccharide synthase
MKYYVIAGEKSGDLHAGNLLKAIHQLDPQAHFRGFGGDDMAAQGMDLVKHYREMAFMGFLEVARNLRSILHNIEMCQQDLMAYQPDVLILVDYPGFNLRIARFAKAQGLRVCYYISPKVWAWNTGRAWKIKETVDQMLVIFPFEVGFYKQFGYQANFVGNPLLDTVSSFLPDPSFRNGIQSEKHLIALLPGSRRQEILQILPKMVATAAHFPDYQFAVAGLSNVPREWYASAQGLPLVLDKTYDLLSCASAALVTSGTATLETALFEVPQVVCYKTSAINYMISKALIKVPYISLVNLVGEKEIVRELIQENLHPKRMATELKEVLPGGGRREWVLSEYKHMKVQLGTGGAAPNAARLITSSLGLGQQENGLV